MSDYISKNNVIDILKETGIIQDNDLGHLVVDEINKIPTLDEKEIIRKAFERVVERLEQQKQQYERREQEHKDINMTVQLTDKYYGKVCSYKHAIEIVKEECGISE